jgi:hypothetical protein
MNSATPAPSVATQRGRTSIRSRVVEKLAAAAVREPGHWWHDAVTAVRARAAADQTSAALHLEVEVAHPIAARSIGADLRQHVTQRIYELTGLTVRRLDVIVVPVPPPRARRVV